jgi:hypothetical protein
MTTSSESSSTSIKDYCEGPDSSSSSSTYSQTTKSKHLCSSKTTLINNFFESTSTYIHIRIPFNFTTVFNTKQAIARVYDQLLEIHEEPFKSITKSVTDISLAIIEGLLEDFRDIIKALPQKTEISTPGRPK